MSKTTFPSLENRIVIVTGGIRGLGREMALELVAAGARVVATGTSESQASKDIVEQAEALGRKDRLIAVAADVTDYAACEMVLAKTKEKFGTPQVLINNAGIGMTLINPNFNKEPSHFWKTNPADWKRVLDININGVFNMSRVVVPSMIEQGFGKVINISTSDITMIRTGYSPYGPSKAALESMSKIWSDDLKGKGVDVMVYLPGGAANTDFIPAGPDRKGADGNLLPADIMRRGITWLASDDSNGKSGRYIARSWNEELPVAEAAAGASTPGRFFS